MIDCYVMPGSLIKTTFFYYFKKSKKPKTTNHNPNNCLLNFTKYLALKKLLDFRSHSLKWRVKIVSDS